MAMPTGTRNRVPAVATTVNKIELGREPHEERESGQAEQRAGQRQCKERVATRHAGKVAHALLARLLPHGKQHHERHHR